MDFEDRIVIATPEGIDLELTLAGAGSRFAAALVDSLLQLALSLALWAVLVLGIGGYGVALFAVAAFLVAFAYHILFEVLASGRTPGKRWTGLRVVRAGGHPVTFLPSATRNILRLVDWLPAVYIVGCISVLVTTRNQRLGDLAAGTLVIRDQARVPAPAQPRLVDRQATQPAGRDDLPAWDVSGITVEELVAVRRFLERRHQLELHARTHLAGQLHDRLRPKPAGGPAEVTGARFLELAARAPAAGV